MDINAVDIGLNTVLHHAVLANKPEICKLLIENGVDVTMTNIEGMLAIDLVEKKQKQIEEILSEHQTKS